MTSRADDRRARELAQRHFGSPLVLEAGAGTGKTAVLVSRIVAWCLDLGWQRARLRVEERSLVGVPAPTEDQIAAEVLRGVVAITFTEAAAAEMASRVGAALLSLRAREIPVGFDEEALPSVSLRDSRAEALVGALDQLAVRTIHATCRRWLSAHAVDAGLRPGFEIDADGQRQVEIVREVLEAHLPEAFGEPFDPDFAVLADAGLGPRDVEVALVSLLGEGALAEDLAVDPIEPDALAGLAIQLREASDEFLRLEAGRLLALAKGASAVVEAVEAVMGTRAAIRAELPRDAETWGPWREEIAECWKDRRAKLKEFARGKFGKKGEAALEDDAPALADAARRLQLTLKHVLAFDPILLAASRRILLRLLAEAQERLRESGVVTFGGLLRGARDLLVNRPDVAEKLRGEIDQILVDEFQDTDALQCEILEALALGGEASERPGLFLVGDPKQSIYGWRGADLRAYEGFVAKACEAGGEVLPLIVNFRSTGAVLDEVERVVAPIMQQAPGLQPAFQRLLPREGEIPEWLPEGCQPVEHWLSWPLDDEGAPDPNRPKRLSTEIEAHAVAADLQRLREAGVSPGDVALLMRSSSDFDVYLTALREAGIPFVVEREEQHGRRREVVDAMAWIRCLLDPNDALALVATLRSSLVGVPDAALIPLWRIGLPERAGRLHGAGGEDLETLGNEVRAVAAALPSGVPGIERIAGWEEGLVAFLGELGPLRALAEEGPVDRFVEALRGPWGLEVGEAGRHLGAHRLGSLDRVFRELADALEATGGSSAAVLSHLRRAGSRDREHREGRRRSFRENAVHVMTVHKAKGLGFQHVYLLQTHKGVRSEATGDTTLERRGGRAEYVLFGAATPGMLALGEERAGRNACEGVRLLYVAATRAKQRLVIVGHRPPSSEASEAGGPAPPRLANASFSGLLEARRGSPEDLMAHGEAVRVAGGSVLDDDGVRWGLPILWPLPTPAGPAANALALPEPSEVLAEEKRLVAAREFAAGYQARPFGGTASSRHDASLLASEASGGVAARSRAMRIGTAFHTAVERLALDSPVDTWRAGLDACLEEQDLDSEMLTRAKALAERFVASPLAERLVGLGERLIGREVPLLLAPEKGEDEPVGFVAGAIDLLYRDERGQVVVADYKTDAIREPEELDRRSRAYASQGRVYVRAVQAALGLDEPPQFELWFIDAGQVVQIQP
ncbi:MAG: UvrD-helicase domain-containing protein [Deltaproteobacteria bacterium]|nr:UvrD-helicase domain-containing protein [Deltaproteobacteria bacterium]MBW2396373.1 UvrD-helicase domain-containing protein [Deltaproteobacteria bacterium]